MSDTVTVYVTEHDDIDVKWVVNDESDMDSTFQDFLNDIYPDVTVAGYQFEAARTLKTLDPIAYNEEFSAFVDNGYTEIEIPHDIYFSDDDEAVNNFLDEHFGVIRDDEDDCN